MVIMGILIVITDIGWVDSVMKRQPLILLVWPLYSIIGPFVKLRLSHSIRSPPLLSSPLLPLNKWLPLDDEASQHNNMCLLAWLRCTTVHVLTSQTLNVLSSLDCTRLHSFLIHFIPVERFLDISHEPIHFPIVISHNFTKLSRDPDTNICGWSKVQANEVTLSLWPVSVFSGSFLARFPSLLLADHFQLYIEPHLLPTCTQLEEPLYATCHRMKQTSCDIIERYLSGTTSLG
jgi:hypothetical protein